MFRIVYPILILSIIQTKNCPAQSFIVGAKKYYVHQPFSQKKTYRFMQAGDSLSINSFYLNDQRLKTKIETSISTAFHELGYQNREYDPQLLVKYQVLSTPARLKGSNTFSKNTADTTSAVYNVDPGTLVISLMDATNGRMLWQGFASGLIDSQATEKNTVLVGEAVRLIMQEYASLINDIAAQ